jgi:hypothetical protein
MQGEAEVCAPHAALDSKSVAGSQNKSSGSARNLADGIEESGRNRGPAGVGKNSHLDNSRRGYDSCALSTSTSGFVQFSVALRFGLEN